MPSPPSSPARHTPASLPALSRADSPASASPALDHPRSLTVARHLFLPRMCLSASRSIQSLRPCPLCPRAGPRSPHLPALARLAPGSLGARSCSPACICLPELPRQFRQRARPVARVGLFTQQHFSECVSPNGVHHRAECLRCCHPTVCLWPSRCCHYDSPLMCLCCVTESG